MKKAMILLPLLFPLSFLCLVACTQNNETVKDVFHQQWVRSQNNPVIGGNSVIIDQVNDPCVVYDEGLFRMYFAAVGVDTSFALVGYAESTDGQNWSISNTPALSPETSEGWDNQVVEIPTVIIDPYESNPERKYKMWYGGYSSTELNLTKVGLAFSPDGISWDRLPAEESPYGQAGLVLIPDNTSPGDYGVISDPTVLYRENTYHMWYSSFDENGLVISYAFSDDGIHWNKCTLNPVLQYNIDSWEKEALGEYAGDVVHPTVIWNNRLNIYLMWYGSFDNTMYLTYTGIGFATSPNGIDWEKQESPMLDSHIIAAGEFGIGTGPTVIYLNNTFHMWCGAVDDSLRRVINHYTY